MEMPETEIRSFMLLLLATTSGCSGDRSGSADPYLRAGERVTTPPETYRADAVCGVKFTGPEKREYLLETFTAAPVAEAKGFAVTHHGACGTCSTLQDLAVYLERKDLTTPVRRCAARVLWKSSALSCLKELGFTEACALTWYYNARNTFFRCLRPCLSSWIRGEPFNRADGSLNACLQCDEEKSGPIFKATAGRTRRNSGIVSEIGRKPGEILDLPQ